MVNDKHSIIESDYAFYKHFKKEKEIIHISDLGYGFLFHTELI